MIHLAIGYLYTKHSDGDYTDPAMQRVHVRNRRIPQVVGVKGRHQTHDGEDDSTQVDGCVSKLNPKLIDLWENTVHKDACQSGWGWG